MARQISSLVPNHGVKLLSDSIYDRVKVLWHSSMAGNDPCDEHWQGEIARVCVGLGCIQACYGGCIP